MQLKPAHMAVEPVSAAITGAMLVDTLLAWFVVRRLWKWNLLQTCLLIVPLGLVDLIFLGSNALKIPGGAWVPLVMAAGIVAIMWTWSRGSQLLTEKTRRDAIPLVDLVDILKARAPHRVHGDDPRSPGIGERETRTMQHLPRRARARRAAPRDHVQIILVAPAVQRVADERMAERLEVHPDLVTAAGARNEAQHAPVRQAPHDTPVGAGRPAVAGLEPHVHAARARGADRQIDQYARDKPVRQVLIRQGAARRDVVGVLMAVSGIDQLRPGVVSFKKESVREAPPEGILPGVVDRVRSGVDSRAPRGGQLHPQGRQGHLRE